MALSASTDFVVTANTLVKQALKKIGGFVEDETISQNTLDEHYITLNMLLKSLEAKGLQTWLLNTSSSNSFTASQASYTMGQTGADITVAQPGEIRSIYIRKTSDSSDVILHPMNREEYDIYSNKTDTGFPSLYLVEKSITLTTITFYLIPNADTATNYTFTTRYRKEIDDIDANSNNIEIPKYFYLAVVYQLAVLLASEYGINLQERRLLKIEADQILRDAMSFDREDEMQIVPDYTGER